MLYSDAFWNSFSFSLHIQFVKIIDVAIHKLQSHEFENLSVACWMIWNCHNKLIFENKSSSSVGLWSSASIYTTEFMEVTRLTLFRLGLLLLNGHHPLQINPLK